MFSMQFFNVVEINYIEKLLTIQTLLPDGCFITVQPTLMPFSALSIKPTLVKLKVLVHF